MEQRLHEEDSDSKSANCGASSVLSTSRSEDPQTVALQALCKQLLKSRLFRGFYEVRYYVTDIQSYRDIVSLHCFEKNLEKLLKSVRFRLLQYYELKEPKLWIGLTMNPISGVAHQLQASDTFIWTELDDLAFGEYWFSIRTVRFRDNEVILKLKVIRPVELEPHLITANRTWSFPTNVNKNQGFDTKQESMPNETSSTSSLPYKPIVTSPSFHADQTTPTPTPMLNDFIEVLSALFDSLKITIYNFLAQDINRDNIGALIRFMCMIILGLLAGGITAIKHLGIFIIYLLAEMSRLTNALTPIILMSLHVVCRIIGALLYMATMMWKDTFGGLRQSPADPEEKTHRSPIVYNRYLSNCEGGNIPYSNIDQNIPRHRFSNKRNPFIIHE